MPLIQPIDLESPGPAENIINAVKAQMGHVPNIFATMAQSPAVLEGYLAFSGALQGGVLSAQTVEQIALAIAGKNQCDYCASAHSALAKGTGLHDDEIQGSLQGLATDNKTGVLIAFALDVVANRGRVSDDDVSTLRSKGVTDRELVELIGHIGLNLFTNYFNHIARTEIDFPFVQSAA